MEFKAAKKITRYKRSLSLSGVIVALSVGVLIPVLLSTSVGIVALVRGEGSYDILIGSLVVSFAAAALGGIAVVIVLLGKRAKIARLQSDLLANVSHDFRTPLSAIRMYAQTLLAGRLSNDPERTVESLKTIVRETEWLETMVDRVLTWRAAAKDMDALDMKICSVREALEEAGGRFSKMIAPEEVEFSICVNTLLPVLHDHHAVYSIVLNLLVNAFKYSGKLKKIGLRASDETIISNGAESRVVICVEDNGMGIPSSEISKIFDPFYRIDTGFLGAAGAGLGLAIVRHLVKAHSGEVYVESEEGRGSCFMITLPSKEDGR